MVKEHGVTEPGQNKKKFKKDLSRLESPMSLKAE